jgi:hypothetical protein
MAVRGTKPAFSVREDLKELQRPIAPSGNSLLTAATPQDAFRLIGAGRRNMIINGKFQVSQRGTYTSLITTTASVYYLDRWFWNGSTANNSFQLKTNQTVNGFLVNTYYYATSNAVNHASSGQQIEPNVWEHLKGKEVTFSAWVKTNNPKVGVRFFTGVQNYGPRHSGSGHWEYLTWTFRIPSDATSLYPLIDSYNGIFNDTSNTYIEITMVQVEEGTIATPFEHRSYAQELELCQRYYYQTPAGSSAQRVYQDAYSASGSFLHLDVFFPVEMRVYPSVSLSGNFSTQGCGTPTVHSVFPNRVRISSTVSGSAGRTYFSLDSGIGIIATSEI